MSVIDRIRERPVTLSPDGKRYLAIAVGHTCPGTFRLRWLIPWICRQDALRWRIAQWGGIVVYVVGTGLMASSWERGIAAGLMMAALPVSRFNMRRPILVDPPALAVAVLAGLAATQGGTGWLVTACVLSVIAGGMKEPAPIFAAIFAWNPVLLVGLAFPLVRYLITDSGEDVLDGENAWILQHPLGASLKYHRGQWLNGVAMVLPWGGALAALGNLDWQVLAALTAGYGSVVLATDTVRLYQWAAPVVCVAACAAVPVAWLPLLVVITIWNPLSQRGA